ncbi:MAG: cytochrome P450 [Rhodobacteraceae bacterium]|nr:cytochrome P450 [Paracoccaceae bacterium]
MIPPKPASRPEKVSLWRYMRLFRADILSAQPARLYRALMAEFRTPFFRSYLCNDPALIDLVLKERPGDFPKSGRIREGLVPLLGRSVFVTNGAEWEFQRRIIDPSFERGRLRESHGAIHAAAVAARDRLRDRAGQVVEIEEVASHAAADVIFRTLFSIPIEHAVANRVFHEFRAYQAAQPLLNIAALLPLPRFFPRFHSRATKRSAKAIRDLIRQLTEARMAEIGAGEAPDDLATKIMTTEDPETGRRFTAEEMTDQVAIFFLAGHETSASALGWALFLLAGNPDAQDRVRDEALAAGDLAKFSNLSRLSFTRNVFREALRLYPPVPMMVRENRCPERFRERQVAPGGQIVLSPWHLHRHERFWQRPDDFDPGRWEEPEGRQSARTAYLPFSAGPRVCPGAGFAMAEGTLLLALLVRDLVFRTVPDRVPVPVARLTVRARSGIYLAIDRRDPKP